MRYLIVDDDPNICTLLSVYLAPFGDTIIANHGEDALHLFKADLEEGNHFNVVFMDISMPDMDGHQVVQEMRDMEKTREISGPERFKLVMITAHSDVKNVTESFFSGEADCYVTKPFSEESLLDELKQAKIIA